MTAPVEPAIARPQGGTSVLERAAIFVVVFLCIFLFLFYCSDSGGRKLRYRGGTVIKMLAVFL